MSAYDERVLDLCDMDYESAEQTCRYIDRLRARVAELEDAGNALAALVRPFVVRRFGAYYAGEDVAALISRADAWRSAAGAPTEFKSQAETLNSGAGNVSQARSTPAAVAPTDTAPAAAPTRCTYCWFEDCGRCTGWAGNNGMHGTAPCPCDHAPAAAPTRCTYCWFEDCGRCTGWAGNNGMHGTAPCPCDHAPAAAPTDKQAEFDPDACADCGHDIDQHADAECVVQGCACSEFCTPTAPPADTARPAPAPESSDERDLACPYCGADLGVETTRHSRHTGDVTVEGIACANRDCGAMWETTGTVIGLPKSQARPCQPGPDAEHAGGEPT